MNYLTIYSYNTAKRGTHINGYHQNINRNTSTYFPPFYTSFCPSDANLMNKSWCTFLKDGLTIPCPRCYYMNKFLYYSFSKIFAKKKILCVHSTILVQSLHLFYYSVTMDWNISTSRISGSKTHQKERYSWLRPSFF